MRLVLHRENVNISYQPEATGISHFTNLNFLKKFFSEWGRSKEITKYSLFMGQLWNELKFY